MPWHKRFDREPPLLSPLVPASPRHPKRCLGHPACTDGPAPPALAIQALNAVDDLGWVGLEVILMLPQDAGSQPEKSRNHGDYRKRLLGRLTSKMRKQ